MHLLKATANPFGGIEIDTPDLPDAVEDFRTGLASSLEVWAREGFKVVWLNVPIARAAIIPVATAAGFQFHHSSAAYLMLTYELETGAFIPPYSTHYIGAGGVVLNEQRELLVVSERYRRDKSRPYWKLPGGALHPGEHLVDGVVREVFEETGVRAEFDALVCFRHQHGYRYDKSDIYFVCRLHPTSTEIIKEEDEIDACEWMPVQDYLSSEYVGGFNKQIVQAALDSPGISRSGVEGYNNPQTHEFFIPV